MSMRSGPARPLPPAGVCTYTASALSIWWGRGGWGACGRMAHQLLAVTAAPGRRVFNAPSAKRTLKSTMESTDSTQLQQDEGRREGGEGSRAACWRAKLHASAGPGPAPHITQCKRAQVWTPGARPARMRQSLDAHAASRGDMPCERGRRDTAVRHPIAGACTRKQAGRGAGSDTRLVIRLACCLPSWDPPSAPTRVHGHSRPDDAQEEGAGGVVVCKAQLQHHRGGSSAVPAPQGFQVGVQLAPRGGVGIKGGDAQAPDRHVVVHQRHLGGRGGGVGGNGGGRPQTERNAKQHRRQHPPPRRPAVGWRRCLGAAP